MKPKVKISQRQNNELNKVVRNFNAKVKRLEKSGRDLELPQKITKKELLESINSKNELKRNMKQLQRFSRKGAEESVSMGSGERISVWEKNEFIIQKRSATAKLTKKIKDLQSKSVKVAGKKQAGTFETVGDSSYLNLLAQRERIRNKRFEDLTKRDLQRYKSLTRKILKDGHNSVFRESYKTMVIDMAYKYGFDQDKTDQILDKIDSLKDKEFLKLFNEDRAIKSILFYYSGTKQKVDDFTPEIITLFEEVYANIDEILKDYS